MPPMTLNARDHADNDTNDIKSLIDALNYFYQKTHNEITLEYILFKDFNDSLKDADELQIISEDSGRPGKYH